MKLDKKLCSMKKKSWCAQAAFENCIYIIYCIVNKLNVAKTNSANQNLGDIFGEVFFFLLHLPVLHFPRSSLAPRHLILETETDSTAPRYWILAEQLNIKLQSNPSEVSGVIVHSKYRDQYIGRRLLLTTKTRNTTFSIVQTISVSHFIKEPQQLAFLCHMRGWRYFFLTRVKKYRRPRFRQGWKVSDTEMLCWVISDTYSHKLHPSGIKQQGRCQSQIQIAPPNTATYRGLIG